MTRAVRGAIQVRENDKRAIYEATMRLIGEILGINAIRKKDIISVLFSLTDDLNAGNPATGLREAGFVETPLFCAQEARVEGGMARVVRALVTFEGKARRMPTAVYLDGAEALRPDMTVGRRP